MGFDIECIVDIHTYPGEYFCPVCRTLVYPSEAVQSQCTHLYCKQCLLHVANGTKACPYDGYLVTEADSKPLVESDKALAENIGKVKVHCLFFRSGCTWEGALSECDAHCSVCSFGNSLVICNRCGVQIVHRQVHEHAQNCAGAYEAQQAVAAAAGSNTAPTITNTETNQPAAQASNGQVVAATQVSSSSQPAVDSSVNSNQQYQQYYQQYPGYQPYPTQPYYQVQQHAYQQYPQQPALVQVQSQPAVNSQATAAPQPHPQLAPQAQAQNYPAIQPLPRPPVRPQAQIPPQSAPPSTPLQAASHPQAMGTRPAGQIAQMPQYQQHHASQAHIQPQMHYPQPLSQPPPIPQPANQPHVQQMYRPQSQPFPRPPHQPIHANGPAMQPPIPQPPVHPAGAYQAFQQPMHADQRGNVGRTSQQQPGSHFGPHHLVRPSGGVMLRDQRSYDSGPLSQPYGNEPGFARMNGGPRPDSSMLDSIGDKQTTSAKDSLDPVPLEKTQPVNPSLGYDAAPKLNAGGLGPHSRFLPPPVGPSRVGSFGPGGGVVLRDQRSYDAGPLSQPHGNETGFAGMNGGPRPDSSMLDSRGEKRKTFSRENVDPFPSEQTPPLNPSLGYDAAPKLNTGGLGPHSRFLPRPVGPSHVGNFGPGPEFGQHNRRPEFRDGPGHPVRGDVAGPGYFSGQFNNAETAGPGLRARMGEFGSGSFHGMRNNFSAQGPPNAAHFAGGVDSFDLSRKRRYISAQWCRICKIDCETLDGLDMHSQTREHQEMAMDMVKTIKQQNMKQHRPPGAHISHDGGRSGKVGPAYHGNQP